MAGVAVMGGAGGDGKQILYHQCNQISRLEAHASLTL
jgi:hypothetical protein